ncbi:hypothetical protein UY3_02017 [Chelonia mydas]|uniref:Ig-like domain-containing protein n=1 Tax=Chelonia mydas TaxID=8469 RepID=M7BY45_CHEMY|nr:hypothetical protein UY3_02017 [Chelonia mydas]
MSCSPLPLLLVLGLLGGCAGKLAVETDASPVRAKVGDDVVLKCQFSVARPPVDLSQLVVQWFHRGGQLVGFGTVGTVPGREQQPGAARAEALRTLNADLLAIRGPLEAGSSAGESAGSLAASLREMLAQEFLAAVHSFHARFAQCRRMRAGGLAPGGLRGPRLLGLHRLRGRWRPAAPRANRTVYSFTPTEQDLGALFSCRARHPALNQSRQADFRITFRAGGLEMGLRVMLWMLRGSLLLAMAMGGWLCCDTGSRPRKMVEEMMEQATERIWDPLRQTFQRAREAISSRSR